MACKHILIVDDDPGIREILAMTLEFDGYNVSSVANGKEALEHLKSQNSPCLVLLDLMMPVMDGFTFIQTVERQKEMHHHPIVVVTAVPERILNLKKTYQVMRKPIEPKHLERLVQMYCETPGNPRGEDAQHDKP